MGLTAVAKLVAVLQERPEALLVFHKEGLRSDMPCAISVGAAGSATSPTRTDSISLGYPPQLRKHAGMASVC